MSAGHAHRLYLPGDSAVHRLAPECKLLAGLLFVMAVVATPPGWFSAFGGYAVLLALVAALGGVPAGFVARRAAIEVPFVAFAVLLPFIARGARVEVLGLALSAEGLLAAWNILAKGTLGVTTSILLAATTQPRDILLGAERLRMPSVLLQIATFMLRYAEVVVDDLRRMRIARESRCFRARDVRGWVTLARAGGALFVRTYERGERVYLAMLSRGYAGSMPRLAEHRAGAPEWAAAGALPAAAVLVGAVAWRMGG
ncbi:MAG: cobalt ECF transporter T component CbiQ [Streptomycetales bacterium]